MVGVREARKLFCTHYLSCFWWARSDLVIRAHDVAWVAENLRKFGGRDAWRSAARHDRLRGACSACSACSASGASGAMPSAESEVACR